MSIDRRFGLVWASVLAIGMTCGDAFAASTKPISYSGRLLHANGGPLAGPVDLKASFYSAPTLGTLLGESDLAVGVVLSEGVFHVDFALEDSELHDVFGDPSQPVWIEVTDVTNTRTYPRQRFGIVPYALKVPVDGKTLAYDEDGVLQINTPDDGSGGYVLTTDGAGALTWQPGGTSGLVEDLLTNGITTKAPSQNVVFDNFATTNGNVTALTTTVGTLSTTVGTLSGDVADATADVAALTTTVGSLSTNVGTLTTTVADKEPAVTAGTASQYYRGDKSWQALDSAVVPENGNLYFTNARAKAATVSNTLTDGVTDVAPSQDVVFDALATATSSIAGKEPAFAAGSTAQYLRGDKSWQTLNTLNVPENTNLYFTNARAQAAAVADAVVDTVANVAPSQNAVFDALAGKQDSLGAGSTLQYLRGDQSWQTLDTTAVPEGANQYFTAERAKTATVEDAIVDGTTDVAPSQNAVFDGLALKQNLAAKNAANGYAGLDASGKILPANLPYSGLVYQGTWNAGTNVPALTSGACGTQGNYYVVSAGGSTTLDTISSWSLGDWVICGGSNAWQRVGNSSGGVTTVNGLTGATVNLVTDNINEGSTNLYFTDLRAKSAAVADSLSNGTTDVAPSQNAVFDALALKEGALTAGTAAQYYRGDKTWQTLSTTNVTEGTNLYYTDARARSATVAATVTDGVTTSSPSQDAVFDALAAKEPTITAGTTLQYLRGDKTWRALDTSVVPENGSLYFTNARAKAAAVSNTLTDGVTDVAPSQDMVFDALATATTSISGKEPAIAGGTTSQFWRGDKTWVAVVADSVTDGVTAVAPSQNAVFDQLALKANTSHAHSSLDASDGTPSAALQVDASGNVGIGTTGPVSRLDVQDNQVQARLKSTVATTSSSLKFENTGSSYVGRESSTGSTIFGGTLGYATVVGSSSGALQFAPGASVRMTVEAAGNVGIGTTAPTQKLEVTSSTQYAGMSISNGTNQIFGVAGQSGTNDNGALVLYDGGVSKTTIFATGNSWFNGGNVGIGTTNPNARLTVDGVTSMKEQASAPSGTSSYGKVYAKTDGKLYFLSSAGVETNLTSPPSAAPAYILITHEVADGTDGGTVTLNTWNVRPFNVEKIDSGNNASVAANVITLAAGTYDCTIVSHVYETSTSQARLYNITGTAVIAYGTVTDARYYSQPASVITTRFTLGASSQLRVEQNAERTSTNDGFGTHSTFTGTPETYATFQCTKY